MTCKLIKTPKLEEDYETIINLEKSPEFQIIGKNANEIIYDGDIYKKFIQIVNLSQTIQIIKINDDTIYYDGFYYKKA